MKKRTKKILIVVLSFLVLIGILLLGLNFYVDSLLNKAQIEEPITEDIKEEEINIVEPIDTSHKVINFMLVGADNLSADRESSYIEERSDVLKIVSLDYTNKTIKLTSLDRDVVVYLPIEEQYGHFNWAYSYGGATSALSTINYNLDLDVSKYVTFSFAGFINVIDRIGGIDVELTQAEADQINSNPYRNSDVYEGLNHLDGHCALSYARIRYIDSDFVRMDRQNTVIQAVITKLKEYSLLELVSLVSDCMPYITTNLTIDEIKDYLTDVITFDLKNIKTQAYPTGEANDVCWNTSNLGGYLLRSYSDQVIKLHQYIYEVEDYKPTQNIYENENRTYELYGEFYSNSELLP